MKHSFILSAFACMMLPAVAGDIKIEDCPQAVRSTIMENSRSGAIDEIKSFSIEGKTLYLAKVELKGGRDLKIHVASDGALVKTREEVILSEVPEAVRLTVESKLGGGKVDEIDKEIAGKAVIYLVEVERPKGPDLELVVDADGKLLSEGEDRND